LPPDLLRVLHSTSGRKAVKNDLYFPPVDELMIADGLTYVVWKDLFNSGTYAMILDNNIEPVPPIPGNVTYASFPWILKMEAVATPKEQSRFNWIWPLLAGLFLFSRR
jgi:hypothetical protein